jgi:hypothetical protein
LPQIRKTQLNEIAKRVALVLELSLSPLLKGEGFRKSGPHFYKSEANTLQVVTVQSSQWNTAKSGRFRVNCGIHFPAVARVLQGADPMPKIPKEHYCILRGLFCMPNVWWTLEPATDLRTVADKLTAYWQETAGPWMEKNKSLAEAATTLELQPVGGWAAAAARLVLGERDEAVRLVKAWIANLESRDTTSAADAALNEKWLREIREWASMHQLMIS